jgi:hypothetical protein
VKEGGPVPAPRRLASEIRNQQLTRLCWKEVRAVPVLTGTSCNFAICDILLKSGIIRDHHGPSYQDFVPTPINADSRERRYMYSGRNSSPLLYATAGEGFQSALASRGRERDLVLRPATKLLSRLAVVLVFVLVRLCRRGFCSAVNVHVYQVTVSL